MWSALRAEPSESKCWHGVGSEHRRHRSQSLGGGGLTSFGGLRMCGFGYSFFFFFFFFFFRFSLLTFGLPPRGGVRSLSLSVSLPLSVPLLFGEPFGDPFGDQVAPQNAAAGGFRGGGRLGGPH